MTSLDLIQVAAAFALLALTNFAYAAALHDWWLAWASPAGAVALVAWRRTKGLITMMLKALEWLFAAPSLEREEHMRETVTVTRAEVEDAARNIHNWGSRNAAAAVGIGALALVGLAPESAEPLFGWIGALAIVATTQWPRIVAWMRQRIEA